MAETISHLRGDGRRIDAAFENAAPGLWPFVAGGFPSANATALLLRALGELPIRGIEVGIPFSDPIADGPVIQQAFTRALESGVRVDDVLGAIAAARGVVSMPILAMVSASIVYRIGMEKFVERAAASGVDGLIVPDLSLEEAPALAEVVGRTGLRMPMLVAPTTPAARQREIATVATGFLYYVSVQGTTGERATLPVDLKTAVRTLREATGLPVVVGFGIGRREQVRQVCGISNGAIVGSAIVKRMTGMAEKGADEAAVVGGALEFMGELVSETGYEGSRGGMEG